MTTTTPEKTPARPLSIQDWDVLIDDFRDAGAPRDWFTSVFQIDSLVDFALSSLLKKDFPTPVKLSILVFLDEFSPILFDNCGSDTFDRFIDVLRTIVQSPTDGSSGLKEQAMVSFTSVLVSIDSFSVGHVEAVVDLLLALVNRPNHGFDRQARAIASERTHAVQAYLLLFTTIVYNVVNQKLKVSLLSTSVPLVPFNAPNWMRDESSIMSQGQGLGPDQKELRRTLAFMLESPYLFTSCAMMEFMGMVVPLASALELQASMLKVQFLGMIYSFDPMLCHVVLLMYSRFPDAFEGQEKEIMRRLMLFSKETQIYLVFRLLALHWLMGLLNKHMLSGELEKRTSVLEMGQKFHPVVFDPLALKALKLDLLVQCSVSSNALSGGDNSKSAGDLLQDCLVSVSDFKWLPPWSSETELAFRTLHKFLICASTHSDSDPSTTRILMESSLFQNVQGLLVDMTLEFQILVPVIVAFIERLIHCHKHQWLGERFLQIVDENLLPKLKKKNLLTAYFPLFHRIAENDTIPPSRLIELLTKFVISLVEKRGLDVGLKLWDQGTEVLGICRTLMSHHKSSRLFLGLSRLLSLTCLYFPDLEVRDNARIYLRMLVCIPGQRIKNILKPADAVTPSTHSSTFFSVQSPRFRHDPSKSRNLSSYIHLERVTPLLVKQSWSLSLPSLSVGTDGYSIIENKIQVDEVEPDGSQELQILPEARRIESGKPTLRVMDSKIAEILERLRRYFSVIPDFKHMPGIKVRITCTLRLDAEPYSSIWGSETQKIDLEKVDSPPAIFATVLKFSSSAPYGSIPSCRIPFLLGEPHWNSNVPNEEVSLDIVVVENTLKEEEKDGLRGAPVTVELEPREPTPGLVEVSMEANAENGQMIQGKLESVPVGIEDMFLKALAPPDEPEDTIPSYYSDLFNALWEVCGSSSSTAHETFALKGGKMAAAVSGTRSVKLLEVPAETVIQATELRLAPFVVAISGEQLVNIVRDGGIIENIVWKEEEEEQGDHTNADQPSSSSVGLNRGPLRLTYIGYGDDQEVPMTRSRGKMGTIKMLMFLPPRYHLMFEMEVGQGSTLVHIRTDYWPCLAYVDDYLEALFL
ncbi:putative AP-5 complex subunit beta-1 protein [Arabidopsis thaliana]|uniref:AP-5 complex subunit beta-like protein n=1 Tax=Arabidopsis thaliana TaxID=3702 RepID=F4JCE9_ARATH|nr:AP-5 complex subunit beta-like protein [Arabidopsis thaliana]AEE76302.1 AP-5 complex subunit beta-like protein [Arabidopsis thaliana]|eukprot:NP_188621.2 AP-5 complex subunit beta-like protein [Arabidopsis thaliana]